METPNRMTQCCLEFYEEAPGWSSETDSGKACEGAEVCISEGETCNVLEPARKTLSEGQVWHLLAHYSR